MINYIQEAKEFEEAGLEEQAKQRYECAAYELSRDDRPASLSSFPLVNLLSYCERYELAAQYFQRAGLEDEAKGAWVKAGHEHLFDAWFESQDPMAKWAKGMECFKKSGLDLQGIVGEAKHVLEMLKNRDNKALARIKKIPLEKRLLLREKAEHFIKHPALE